MGQIKVKLENFASEANVNAAVNAANNSAPNGAVPAQVKRDSNGKAIEVVIGMPGNPTAQERTAARDAVVSNNPGIATAISFPFEEEANDLDGLTPDAVLIAKGSGDEYSIISDPGSGELKVLNLDANSVLEAGKAAESDGATGSSLRIEDKNSASTNISNLAEAHIAWSKNIAEVYHMTLEFALNMQDLSAGDEGDGFIQQRRLSILSSIITGNFEIDYASILNSGNIRLVGDVAVNTTLSPNDLHNVKIEYNSGLFTLTVGAFSVTKTVGFPANLCDLDLKTLSLDLYTVAAVQDYAPWIFDTFKLNVIDGQE